MGLRILIVGGGIAGLATALALRRAGHTVQVFEKYQLEYKDTVGPTVHIGPKSNDLMRNWGYDAAEARGVRVREIDEYNIDGSLRDKAGANQPPGWMYYERSRLHRSLFKAATSPNGPGRPVETFLGPGVESACPETAQISLSDGRIVRGDVVIGADGFHSTVRSAICNSESTSSGPTKVAVHFSVPTSQSGPSSMIQRFKADSERYEKWIADILQLNVYCVEPEHLLFDCTLSTQGQANVTGSWVKQHILDALKSAHPEFTKAISAMEPSNIHFWTQPILPCVDNWISNRLVLVGDAAHPFLPHELPGTSQTLNDAAALATELSPDVGVDKVEERLRSWEGPRKNRVRVIQQSECALQS